MKNNHFCLNETKSKEPKQNVFYNFSKMTGELASTAWQNANIATAKTALGTVAGTAGAVASGVGSTIFEPSDKTKNNQSCPSGTKSKEPILQNVFNNLSEKTGKLASTAWQNGSNLSRMTGKLASTAATTAWQNANIATAKAALAVASDVGSSIYKQAGTARAVAGGIGSTIVNQAAKMMDRNQKLKDRDQKLNENFACYYYLNDKPYVGTIHFTRNELIFSCEGRLPQHIKNTKRDLPLLPIGQKSWEDCDESTRFLLNGQYGPQITLTWGDIKEINIGGDPENPFVRYIEIITHQKKSFLFMGFLDHQKAFAHLYSLLESSSWS